MSKGKTIDANQCSRCFKKLTNDDPQLLITIMDLEDMFSASNWPTCHECYKSIELILQGVH